MASRATNAAVEVLQRRHAAERAALEAAASAGRIVQRAEKKRAAELARLDEVVASAQRQHDLAVAVLAALMPSAVVASLVDMPATQVRQSIQRAPMADVEAALSELVGDAVGIRRRRRRRAAGDENDHFEEIPPVSKNR